MKYLERLGTIFLSAIFTLFLLGLIISYAPLSITNIFLNPMKVVEGLKLEQEREYEREAKESQAKFETILKEKRDVIFDNSAPFLGAKNPKVEIVIFSDYRCGYCKALSLITEKIISDPKYKNNVKIIVKELPILGQSSRTLAVAAFESFKESPENFEKVHKALFSLDGSKEAIIKKVKEITGKTIKVEEKGETLNFIQANLLLASEIGIRGTPGIIIGNELIGGLLPEDQLKAKIDEELAK